MTVVSTLAIYSDTRGAGRCRGCGGPLEWAEIVGSGKRMPFDPPIVALRTEQETATGRVIEHVDRASNHWASCPNRDQFRRR